MQNTYLNGVDIKVEPFDLDYTGETYKLDLLYYNNINRFGEVLSSLVYNSGVRAIDDTTLIVYDPNKLFLNTAFEQNYELTGTSNRWKNADLLTGYTTNLKDNSADATYSYERFNTTSGYSVTYSNGEHSYDGWYTLYSVVLRDYPDSSPSLLQGTLRNNSGVAQYALQDAPVNIGDWANLDDGIDTTIDIYNFIREDRGEIYKSYDFVATVKINSLNKRLLDNKLDSGWYKKLNILSPKIRTLETAIEFKNYDKAQYMINAVNNSLLSLLI